MKSGFCLAALFLVCVFTPLLYAQYTTRWHIDVETVSQLVIFGDDYSDIDNTYIMTGGAFPNPAGFDGYIGPVSNGPVWWQQLNRDWFPNPLNNNSLINNAYIGAGINSAARPQASHVPGTAIPVPGVLQQISAYFSSAPSIPDNTLFVIWAGTNEFLAYNGTPSSAVFLDTITTELMNAQLAILTNPLVFGRPVQVLTAAVLPYGSNPYINAVFGNVTATNLNNLIGAFNGILRAKILGYKNANQTAALFTQAQWVDLTAEFARMAGKPAQYGFHLTGGPLQGPSGAYCYNPTTNTQCDNVDGYYWWNPYWISSQAHHWIASRIFNEAFEQGEQYFYDYF